MTSILPNPCFLIVDDHENFLSGTVRILEEHYPDITLLTAKTAADARNHLESSPAQLLLLDLSIPEQDGEKATVEIGLQLLRDSIPAYPDLNIVVLSSHMEALSRIVHNIDEHPGGFTTANKTLSEQELLVRIELSLKQVTYTKDIEGMRAGRDMRPEWYDVLHLAFKEGLIDKLIAQRMNRSERTIRVYWSKIYDVLEIYPQNGKNLRIQTEIKAREIGLID